MLIDYNYSVLHSNLTPQALPCWDLPGGDVLSVPHAYLKNEMKKYLLNLKKFKIWHYQMMLLCPDYNVTKTQNRRC